MSSKQLDTKVTESVMQERQILMKTAEVLAQKKLLTPSEKARFLQRIREGEVR